MFDYFTHMASSYGGSSKLAWGLKTYKCDNVRKAVQDKEVWGLWKILGGGGLKPCAPLSGSLTGVGTQSMQGNKAWNQCVTGVFTCRRYMCPR